MWMTPDVLVAVAAVVTAIMVTVAVDIGVRRRRGQQPEFVLSNRSTPSVAPRAVSLLQGLGKTRQGLLARLQGVWASNQGTEARLLELEEVLISSDVGVKATHALLGKLRARAHELGDVDALWQALCDEMTAVLASADRPADAVVPQPLVILVAGVNGVGKTTTIGKLAFRFVKQGKKVLLVAADTFRAAAGEQLQRWAERADVDCVQHQQGADPAAVAFDGMAAAVARGVDIVIVDTAGRLHVKQHLVEELKKIARTIARQIPGAPHESLLVIDATTGQNAINQARVFQDALNLTGIVLTKLDGTAKGGAVFAIRAELGVPIRYVGLGESVEDLQPFDAKGFVRALLDKESQG